MQGLLEGTLSIDLEAECVTVIRADGSSIVVVWPEGYLIDATEESRPTLVTSGGFRHDDGDQVAFGGGDREVVRLANTSAYDHLEASDVCDATMVFLANGS